MRSKLRNYISQQTQLLQSFRYKTPKLVSDSKGFTIRNACAQNRFPIESWCKAGTRTSELVDIIQERIQKAIKRHNQIVIYLLSGTCDLTIKKGKFIELRHSGKKTVDQIVEQFHRAINIVAKYPTAEIKFIDCPILSIVQYNTHKGHNKPEIFKVDHFSATRQVIQLNARITDFNNSLFKNTIHISKYFFRGRKVKRGGTRKSINKYINKKDGVHTGQLYSLAIAKQILLDTYKECYHIRQQSELLQLHTLEAELLSLFKDQSEVRIWKREDDGGTCSKGFRESLSYQFLLHDFHT